MKVLLSSRSLVAVLVAELVSFTGSTMTYVALPWFVLTTTGSTARMGWVLAAELIPVALLGIPSGSLIARLGAKVTMNVADAARVPLLALIPILYWTGHLSFPALLVIAFLIGTCIAPYYGSSQLILPEVLGDNEQLVAQGSAFIQAASQLTTIIGPVLAGILIAWRGAPVILIVDAATYLFSFVVILLFVRVGKRVAPTEQSRGVLAGLRYVLRDRLLGPLTAVFAGMQIAMQGLVVSLPVLAFRRYHQDPHIVGYLYSAFGTGALLGSLLMAHFAAKAPLSRIASWAIIAMAVPLWLLMFPMPWPLLVVDLAAFSVLAPFVNAPIIGILTVRTPTALRPKVITAVMTLSSVAGPVGIAVLGEALAYLSLTSVYLMVAAIFTTTAIAFCVVFRRADSKPSTVTPEAAT